MALKQIWGNKAESDHSPVDDTPSIWRYRKYCILISATGISTLGTSMSGFALAFTVLEKTHHSFDLAIILAAQSFSTIIFILLGGVLADNLSRSHLLISSNTISGIIQTMATVCLFVPIFHLDFMIFLAFLGGISQAFTGPALRGAVKEILPNNLIQSGNSAKTSLETIMRMVGPVLASIVLVDWGGVWAVGADALSFFMAAFLFVFLGMMGKTTSSTGLLKDLRIGWLEFVSRKWVITITATFFILNLLSSGFWGVIGRLLADMHHSETEWSYALSLRSLGIFLGGLALYKLKIKHALAWSQIGMVCGAIPFIAVGWYGIGLFVILSSGISGIFSAFADITWETLLQTKIPPAVVSRVGSYDQLGSFMAVPVGQLLAVPAVTIFGMQWTLLLAGSIYAVIAILPVFLPSVRAID